MKSLRIFLRLIVSALALCLTTLASAQSPTRTRLHSSPNPSAVGRRVVLAAEIDGLGDGAPTGAVIFRDGATTLGAATLHISRNWGRMTVEAGHFHSCALTAAGGVACWGDNAYGQLGDGTTIQRLTPTPVSGLSSGVVALAAGAWHSCALTSGGDVKCWGRNIDGQLGDGTTIDRRTPTAALGLSRNVIALSGGTRHTCALTDAGAVKCWGLNVFGQVGDGTTLDRHAPTDVSLLSKDIVAVTAGNYHNCAMTAGGDVSCWGYNEEGQLGDGTQNNRLEPVPAVGLPRGIVMIVGGERHTCALTFAGAVNCWGWNSTGQLGDGSSSWRSLTPVTPTGMSSGVAALTAGGMYSCARKISDGGVWCWGANESGQLGDGTTTLRRAPVAASSLANGIFTLVSGANHTCALNRRGGLKCWGLNHNGQLGDRTTTNRSTPVTTRGLVGLVRMRARLATTSLGVGAHALSAHYSGDARHTNSLGRTNHNVQ